MAEYCRGANLYTSDCTGDISILYEEERNNNENFLMHMNEEE